LASSPRPSPSSHAVRVVFPFRVLRVRWGEIGLVTAAFSKLSCGWRGFRRIESHDAYHRIASGDPRSPFRKVLGSSARAWFRFAPERSTRTLRLRFRAFPPTPGAFPKGRILVWGFRSLRRLPDLAQRLTRGPSYGLEGCGSSSASSKSSEVFSTSNVLGNQPFEASRPRSDRNLFRSLSSLAVPRTKRRVIRSFEGRPRRFSPAVEPT